MTFWKRVTVFIFVKVFVPTIAWACSDATLLDLTDRGSITNTPCTLSPQTALLELGYQYQPLLPGGVRKNFPQANIFLGLQGKNEFILGLPNYYQLSTPSVSGYGSASLGMKHEFTLPGNWGAATEVFFTPPSGSPDFGSAGLGATINGIISYTVNPQMGLVLMFGENTITEPSIVSGRRFNTFNASLVGVYKPIEKMSLFAELFSEEKTTSERAGNYNVDCGLLYMWKPSIVFDLEVGQQLSHQDDHFNRFINGGVSMLFTV